MKVKIIAAGFLLAAALLIGVIIGVSGAARLEPFLEPIVTLFAGPEEYILVPIDYNPFLRGFDI